MKPVKLYELHILTPSRFIYQTSEEEKQQIGSFYGSVAIVCLWILVLPAYYKVTKKVGACADPVFFFAVKTMILSLQCLYY